MPVPGGKSVGWRNSNGSTWTPISGAWIPLPGDMVYQPTAVETTSMLHVFARASDGKVTHSFLPAASRNTESLGGEITGRVAAAVRGNDITIAVLDKGGGIYTKVLTGGNWFPTLVDWTSVGCPQSGGQWLAARGRHDRRIERHAGAHLYCGLRSAHVCEH